MAEAPPLDFVARFPALGFEMRSGSLIKNWTLESNFLQASDAWSITLVDERGTGDLRVLALQPIEITLDGKPQLVGRVDSVEHGDDLSVTIRGRDYIADMLECSVDPALKLGDGMTLRDVVTMAAGPVGIHKVARADELALRNVISGKSLTVSDPGKDFAALELKDYKPNPGESIYAFLDRILARHRVTMQPTPDDRKMVVLAQPMFNQSPCDTIVKSRATSSAGNIGISARAKRDYSKFATHVLVTGKQQGGGDASGAKVSSAGERSWTDEAIDIDIDSSILVTGRILPTDPNPNLEEGLYRMVTLRDELSRTVEQLAATAYRIYAERYKDSLEYEVTVPRLTTTSGGVWACDTIVSVQDEVCGVTEDLWVEGRRLSYEADRTPTATLTCLRPGSYVLGS